MKRIKYTVMLLILAVSLISTAYAADSITVKHSITGDVFSLTGKTNDGEAGVVLFRLTKATGDSFNVFTDVVYLEQKETNADGTFEFSFVLDNTSQDVESLDEYIATEYTYSVGKLGDENDVDLVTPIKYYGSGYQETVIKLINEAKTMFKTSPEAAKASLEATIEKSFETMALPTTVCDEYMIDKANYEEFIELMLTQRAVADYNDGQTTEEVLLNTLDELTYQFDRAAVIAMVKSEDYSSAEVTEQLSDATFRNILGIEDSAATALFDEYKEYYGEDIGSAFSAMDYKDVDEAKSAFEFSVVSTLLSEATTATEVANILGKCKDIIGFDIEDYDLTNKELTKLSGMTISTYKDIETKIKQLIKDRTPKKESSSGGGGGGRPAGIVVLPQKADDTPLVEEEKKPAFDDLKGFEWAEESIMSLFDKKIINGKAESKFAPADSIKREEFIKMIVEALDVTNANQPAASFKDVSDNAWYAEYINTAYQNNIVNGIAENMFGVGENITREDATVIMYRALRNKNLINDSEITQTSFVDNADIAEYAVNAVANLNSLKIVNGNDTGLFMAKDNLSRAQAAVLINNVLNYIAGL